MKGLHGKMATEIGRLSGKQGTHSTCSLKRPSAEQYPELFGYVEDVSVEG
jgi:hypothetical protein